MKVAYLAAPGQVHYAGRASGQRYHFTPWADVDERDWPELRAKIVVVRGCCNKPARPVRLFGSEEEIANGVVGFNR
jgi:hypothetical protein